MEVPATVIPAHPVGEGKTAPKYPSGSWPVDTPGGRFHAEWDDQAPVSRACRPIRLRGMRLSHCWRTITLDRAGVFWFIDPYQMAGDQGAPARIPASTAPLLWDGCEKVASLGPPIGSTQRILLTTYFSRKMARVPWGHSLLSRVVLESPWRQAGLSPGLVRRLHALAPAASQTAPGHAENRWCVLPIRQCSPLAPGAPVAYRGSR